MKDHQLNLSALSKDLDKNKYLDALAAPYNLNVSKTRKKDIFAVDMYDGTLFKLFKESAIIPYDTAWINELAKPAITETRANVHIKEHVGERIASVKFLQDSNLYELDIVSVEEPPIYACLNLASVRKINENEFINELRQRFEYRYFNEENGDFAVMIDRKAFIMMGYEEHNPFDYKHSVYPVSSETIEHMKNEKMSEDQMKEYLLKNREWFRYNAPYGIKEK